MVRRYCWAALALAPLVLLAAWMPADAALDAAMAAPRTASRWSGWHERATRALASMGAAREPVRNEVSESLARHLEARELLEATYLPRNTRDKLHGGLDLHAAALDKAMAAISAADSEADSIMGAIRKAEASLAKRYRRALRAGLVPSPRPTEEEMRAALRDATGIDAERDEDGQLFNVMVKHYAQSGVLPPAEALGVSAKFFADGTQQVVRYHVGLRLPCAQVDADDFGDAAARLASSGKAAAEALSAPALVHAWVEAVGNAPVGLGFGLAHLDDTGVKKGGKIYIMNLAGNLMPALPLSTSHASSATIYDSIPALRPGSGEAGHRSWLDSHMVSLEWQVRLITCMYVCMMMYVSMYGCVYTCVCVCERERERELWRVFSRASSQRAGCCAPALAADHAYRLMFSSIYCLFSCFHLARQMRALN